MHVLVFGLLEILLLIFFALVTIGFALSFGHPALSRGRSRCPTCGAESLMPLEAGRLPGRFTVYRCQRCSAAFRAQPDGSLAAIRDDSP